jgi:GrpB-like predicted nucleotidyltransferase (UPF0157 family)/GNAT superfamily N-acetyltransferase
MRRKIEVVPYNMNWPRLFEEESAKIKQALGNNCVVIHHVGSTAVPYLCAKPKIDIITVVNNPDSAIQVLEGLGYQYKGEYNIPFHLGFVKRGHFPEINLHVYEQGNSEVELNLMFRDYLRHHPQVREEYAALKLNLVSQKELHAKNNAIFSGYNLGKDTFIKKVLNLAGFKGLCMRFCTHTDEWEAARTFRQKYFFDNVPTQDPYTWTFDNKDHVHLVLYSGVQIVGYAHIQLWKDNRAALWIIVIDEPFRNQGLGKQFLTLCEQWLKKQGFKTFHANASPKAYLFYKKLGYIEMPYNDPDGSETHPQDVEVGKVL